MSAHYTKKYKKAKNISMRIKRFKETFNANSVIPFGKYKGNSVEYIRINDISYYNWLIKELNLTIK